MSSPITPKSEAPSPRIYVASLRDYNAGRLHGIWLTVGSDGSELAGSVRRMPNASIEEGAEEWAIHDYEGFGDFRIPENTRLETVIGIAAAIGVVDRIRD